MKDIERGKERHGSWEEGMVRDKEGVGVEGRKNREIGGRDGGRESEGENEENAIERGTQGSREREREREIGDGR